MERDYYPLSGAYTSPSTTGLSSSDGTGSPQSVSLSLSPTEFELCFRFQVLYLALKTLSESGHQHVYNAVERPLLLAQSATVLEIVHGLVGLVRSPVTATLPQIGSRLYLTWGILWSFPEIIRYSFFGMKEALGFAPSWLLWLRYSTFILLYPTGITSEVGLIYIALPHMKNSEKYSIRMPNKWNFCFDYFYAAIVALGIYVPGMHRFHGHDRVRSRNLDPQGR